MHIYTQLRTHTITRTHIHSMSFIHVYTLTGVVSIKTERRRGALVLNINVSVCGRNNFCNNVTV